MEVAVSSPAALKPLSPYQAAGLYKNDKNDLDIARPLTKDEAVILSLGGNKETTGGASAISPKDLVAKINELIKARFPGGAEELSAEQARAEPTAERIFSGIVSLLPAFARQNPKLGGEELISKFMAEVRKGVELGFSQATKDLDDLGAFEFAGLKDLINETKKLLDDKLKAFENSGKKGGSAAESAGAAETLSFSYSLRVEATVSKSETRFSAEA